MKNCILIFYLYDDFKKRLKDCIFVKTAIIMFKNRLFDFFYEYPSNLTLLLTLLFNTKL